MKERRGQREFEGWNNTPSCWMRRKASPMECAPVAQAVETAWFGPCDPQRFIPPKGGLILPNVCVGESSSNAPHLETVLHANLPGRHVHQHGGDEKGTDTTLLAFVNLQRGIRNASNIGHPGANCNSLCDPQAHSPTQSCERENGSVCEEKASFSRTARVGSNEELFRAPLASSACAAAETWTRKEEPPREYESTTTNIRCKPYYTFRTCSDRKRDVVVALQPPVRLIHPFLEAERFHGRISLPAVLRLCTGHLSCNADRKLLILRLLQRLRSNERNTHKPSFAVQLRHFHGS